MRSSARRITTALVVLSLGLGACGTQVDPEYYAAALEREGRAPTVTGSGTVDPMTGEPFDPLAPDGPFTDVGTTDGDGTVVAAPGDTAGQAPPGADRRRAAASDDPSARAPTRRGSPASSFAHVSDAVVGDVITVGMHVPVTGAAPIPADWEDALRAVEDFFNRDKPVHGRQIRLLVEDDGYDASMGRAACRRLLAADPILVIGHTMPAAQDACAALFNERGIPYLMRGTTPEVLKDRPLAFFGTVPDDIQGRLLADYVLRELDAANRPVGVLFQDDQLAARDTFVARIRDAGGTVPVIEQGAPRQSDFGASIQKFRAAGVELVFLSTPPVDAIQIAVQAHGEGYRPTWLGGGSYWNYNMTLEAAGTAMDGAISLSPWPTIDSPAANEFKEVFRQRRPDKEPEDIGLIMWGWSNLLHQLLDDAGPDLSRRSVAETLQTFEYRRPYWNPVSYERYGRAGAGQVAVFRADGQARRWRQISDFTDRF